MFFRKHSGQPTLEYEAAVEEALCFGWIDSVIKQVDEQKYLRKFTPRKASSLWSPTNKRRVARLLKQGRMTRAGLAKVDAARNSGQWGKNPMPELCGEVPAELAFELKRNKAAGEFFDQLAPSYRRQFIGWVQAAKRSETKQKRIAESMRLLATRKKLGMK